MEQEAPEMNGGEFLHAAEQGSGAEGRGDHVMEVLGQEGQEPSPQMLKQLENINGAMVDMMYRPETKSVIQKMLTDAPPEMALPHVTNMLMQKFEDMMEQKNGPMDLQMKLGVGVMTFSEVTELAQGLGKMPQDMPEEQTQELLKATIQQYIQKGLKEKTIDPIELQEAVEPLLTPEEQAMARGMGQEVGTPGGPTREMTNAMGMQKAKQPLEVRTKQLEKQNMELNKALQGVAQGGGQ